MIAFGEWLFDGQGSVGKAILRIIEGDLMRMREITFEVLSDKAQREAAGGKSSHRCGQMRERQ